MIAARALPPESADAPWLIVRSLQMTGERMANWLRGVETLGYSTYYPMIRELRPVPRRKLSLAQRNSSVSIMRPNVVPFLPSMIFVRANRLGHGSILDHPGVIGFIAFGNEPARISDALIMRLRQREAAGDGAIPGGTPVEYIFKSGDKVQVVNGAFALNIGIVDDAPDATIEGIDADTRLKLTVGRFRVQVAVGDVRHV
jgi:transcription antitermination factor NusG